MGSAFAGCIYASQSKDYKMLSNSTNTVMQSFSAENLLQWTSRISRSLFDILYSAKWVKHYNSTQAPDHKHMRDLQSSLIQACNATFSPKEISTVVLDKRVRTTNIHPPNCPVSFQIHRPKDNEQPKIRKDTEPSGRNVRPDFVFWPDQTYRKGTNANLLEKSTSVFTGAESTNILGSESNVI